MRRKSAAKSLTVRAWVPYVVALAGAVTEQQLHGATRLLAADEDPRKLRRSSEAPADGAAVTVSVTGRIPDAPH
jgi:hypothetical protein